MSDCYMISLRMVEKDRTAPTFAHCMAHWRVRERGTTTTHQRPRPAIGHAAAH